MVLVGARVYGRLKVDWAGHEPQAVVRPLALRLLVSCMIL